MGWNPSPEVAAARDASQAVDAPMLVMVWIDRDGKNIHMASYGETKPLCGAAGELGAHLFDAAKNWGAE